MKRKKKTSRQKTYKDLDKAWQEKVVARDKECMLCGGVISCGHHIFPKSRGINTRWDLENGIGVCVSCHYGIHDRTLSAEYNSRIQEVIGMERWNKIRKASHIVVPYIPIEELKDKLKTLTFKRWRVTI